ncbi:MAG TPA: 50S ribosomal protein L25, partial [Sulfitobacter sp.]|nr:50S ribosomal protein L25 [Sulfitobacter sp.]
TGKGAARQARRDGMVPGIVFGGDLDPLPINLDFNKLLTKLRAGRFKATLFNLKVEGQEDVRVICRDVQRHVVKDLPTHVDLMRLKRTTKINLFIQVEVEGEEVSPGLKKGGVLTLVRPEVELVVTAGDIPDHITIDVSELEIGDSLTISSVKLPNGTKPVIDRDFVIAQISAPSGLASQDDDEDEDVAADEVPATEVKED